MNDMTGVDALRRLGFTEIEAAIYVHLLSHSPSTIAQIAAATGRAEDATARAVAVLLRKGGAIADADDPDLVRAASPRELVEGLQLAYELDCDDAERTFAGSFVASEDHRVYTLTRAEHALDKARHFIATAQETLLIDLAPRFADLLAEDVAAAKRRGIGIGAILYGERDGYADADTPVVLHPPDTAARLPYAHLTVVADARDTLLASFTPEGDRLAHAAWTSSYYLSGFFHNGMVTEIIASFGLGRRAPGAADQDAAVRLSITLSRPPGFRLMAESIAALSEHPDERARRKARFRVVPK